MGCILTQSALKTREYLIGTPAVSKPAGVLRCGAWQRELRLLVYYFIFLFSFFRSIMPTWFRNGTLLVAFYQSALAH